MQADAEDLTQEIFIKLFHKIDTFRGDSAFTTWLYRMSFNTVLMHFRKQKTVKEEITSDGEFAESALVLGQKEKSNRVLDKMTLDEAIGELPDGYRDVFVLHVVQGFEHEEISRILGCAVGTSKSQLFKAKRKLRKLLTEDHTFSIDNLQTAA